MDKNRESNKRGSKLRTSIIIVSGLFSIIAMIVSLFVAYTTVLKPFDIEIRVDPRLSIQHKVNLGIYIDVDFYNDSPKDGLITKLALVIYRESNKEDKYLLTFNSFRILKKDGVYGPSEETLPLF